MKKSCAACDYPLDDSAIEVRIGSHVVEVCCEECAQKLRDGAADLRAAQVAMADGTAVARG